MNRPHLFDRDTLTEAYGCYNPPANVYAQWHGLEHTGQRYLTREELAAQSGRCVVVTPARSEPRRHTPLRTQALSQHPDHVRGRRARELLTRDVLVDMLARGMTLRQVADWSAEQIGLPVHTSLAGRIAQERGLSWSQRR